MQERERELVLILGPEERTRLLAGRILLFDYRSARAAELDGALRVQAGAPAPIRVGLIATEHGLPDLREGLARLAAASGTGSLRWIAFGQASDPAELATLRQAGVRYALLEPFTDEELRFVINEAHHEGAGPAHRGEARVPATLRARVLTKTGEKPALVYNLSPTGAYLVTPRPTMRGGAVKIYFALPSGEAGLDAHVMWNNVPGNLRRYNAPVGMGVRFVEVSGDVQGDLQKYVDERAKAYLL